MPKKKKSSKAKSPSLQQTVDNLASRFILNLPSDDALDGPRLFYQLEQVRRPRKQSNHFAKALLNIHIPTARRTLSWCALQIMRMPQSTHRVRGLISFVVVRCVS